MKQISAGMILLSAMLFSGLIDNSAHAANPVWSVETFNRLKPKWDSFGQTRLRVEGRYSALSGGLLKFKNCDLQFRSKRGQKLPRPTGADKTVEVTGYLTRENGKRAFIVLSLKRLDSDLNTFKKRKTALRGKDPVEWYKLAEWAAGRSKFYDDEELAAKAVSALERAIDAERRTIPANDGDALYKLAVKAKDLGVSTDLELELMHVAYRVQWKQAKTPDAKTLWNLAEQITKDLSGSEKPLEPPQPKLSERYAFDPVDVYRQADLPTRKKLNRVFYGEVALAAILKNASADGSNGFAVAADIDKHLPERHELAETYRDNELKYKLADVGTLKKSQAVELAGQFRKRKQPKLAKQTFQDWLTAKKQRLRKDDGAGLMQLAEEYHNLLEDDERAGKLLLEAAALSPNSPEITERLQKLGYEKKNGRWLSARVAKSTPFDAAAEALRNGMTPAQVRSIMGGAPTFIAKSASSRHISEVWIYGERNTSRHAIHFQRYRRKANAEAEVVGISQLNPR